MNLAPILLYRRMDWKTPEGPVFQLAEQVRSELAPKLPAAQLQAIVGVLQIVYWKTLSTGGGANPVGLLSIDRPTWERAIHAFEKRDRRPQSNVLCRASPVDDTNSMLLFPDDLDDRPVISLFVPTRIAPGTVAFHAISFALESGSAPLLTADETNGCTIGRSGLPGEEELSCSEAGCDHECKPLIEWEQNGETATLVCEC